MRVAVMPADFGERWFHANTTFILIVDFTFKHLVSTCVHFHQMRSNQRKHQQTRLSESRACFFWEVLSVLIQSCITCNPQRVMPDCLRTLSKAMVYGNFQQLRYLFYSPVFESARLANEQVSFNEIRDGLKWLACNSRYLTQEMQ